MPTPHRRLALSTGLLLLSAVVAAPDAKDIEKEAARLRSGDTDRWRKIPWASSLSAAVATAGKEQRMLFIFSYDGNIETGRC